MVQFAVGKIIKMFEQTAVITGVFESSDGEVILRVEKTNNLFRGRRSELIEVSRAPGAIKAATIDDLMEELSRLRCAQDAELENFLSGVTNDS